MGQPKGNSMEAFIDGFLLQASLIFALGAQNIFVLESGIKKQRPFFVALVCSLCDTFLILLGVFGAGGFFAQNPWLKIIFGAVGVIFLVYYGFLKIFERPTLALQHSSNAATFSLKKILLNALGFTFLNPHTYLDTIVLIGRYSASFVLHERLFFAGGTIIFSWIWFFALSFFAASFSRLLNQPARLRLVLAISGAVLLYLAYHLFHEVWSWMTLVSL